ncbi:MAG: DegQ family serine endoprotease [Burkholderiales bacterium]|nr:DegQ family serine endoprotease [Burkholderiales bacterium]
MKQLHASLVSALAALLLAVPGLAQQPRTPALPGASAQVLPDFADLVEKYGPAVVNINTQARRNPRQALPGLAEDDPFYEFFRRFMPPDGQGRGNNPRGNRPQPQPDAPRGPLQPFGLGSGFILSADGFIVTNAHVVENAEEINVRLNDKREFKARVIGADTRSDVAVIKIDGTNLPTVKIGDLGKVRVGEWVIAIGSPFGFANTVTAGIVSAKSRENLSGDPNLDAVPFIQTDVAVNPGNSGGPLLNMRGEVIGINSQIFSRTGSFAGISFAIPIDYAFNVADQLMKTGHVTRGRIGVSIGNVTRDLAESLGLPKPEGAAVSTVEAESPAAKAGIEVGDVITKLDGRAVEGSADLSRTIRSMKPGSKVNLTVWRSGKTRDIAVTIAEFKDDEATKTAAASRGKKEAAKTDKLGLAVKEVTADQKKALKVQNGVAVEAADGAALAAGISPGDVILRVNNIDISGVKSFNDTVAKLDAKKPVALLIRDENGTRFITFRPDVG